MERRRRIRRAFGWGAPIALVLLGACAATWTLPGPFFAHSRAGTFITVHSDAPVPPASARVIRLAEERVRRSPLFDPARMHHVYVCTTDWRWSWFSFFDARSRAFATPLGRAVYTREARWDRNRLLGPAGDESARTLDTYLAHEVTHVMTTDDLGVVAAARLPAWVREGYAEYVARVGTFEYRALAERFRRDEAELVLRRRDPYLRCLLVVAHLIEREGWSVRRLMRSPPEMRDVEARIRGSRRTSASRG